MSIQEVKFLLDQAEKSIIDKEKRINILERIIKLLGETPYANERELKDLEKRLK